MKRVSTTRRDVPRSAIRLVGLVSVVVVAVAMYVSVTAINGIPGVPTYDVSADVPNADQLIATDEVRIAGVRVGEVAKVTAVNRGPGGTPYAQLQLHLATSTGHLPVDTRASVQASSVLGATYLDLVPGTSRRRIPNGGTLTLRNGRSTVQLTDLLDIFNQSTANGIRSASAGLGDGFAGRGASLNGAIAALDSALPPLTSLSRVLASPATQLGRFISGYDAFSSALADAARPLAQVIPSGATTFAAINRRHHALTDAIAALPQTERDTTAALEAVRPALLKLAPFAQSLRHGAELLPTALTQIDTTASTGVRPAREIPGFAPRLTAAVQTLGHVATIPSTSEALNRLTQTTQALGTFLDVLGPAQLQCNIVSLFGVNFSGATTATSPGPAFANISVITLGGQLEELQHAAPSPNEHINYLPTENASECASGNEPISNGLVLSNPTGLSNTTRATKPPPGTLALARKAGLLTLPKADR